MFNKELNREMNGFLFIGLQLTLIYAKIFNIILNRICVKSEHTL